MEAMNRRGFLINGAAMAALGSLVANATRAAEPGPDEPLRALVRANDEQIPGLLAQQARTAGGRWPGGVLNEYGIPNVAGTNGFVSALACAACAPGSKYFRSEELVKPMRLAIGYMLSA